jgi:hypothetical protein
MNKPEVKSAAQSHQSSRKITKDELARQIKRMRERDEEIVTGVFKNLENPATAGGSGSVSFGFKKYEGDDYRFYEFMDGERYSIPRAVAHHLNNDCYYREYQHLQGERGEQGIRNAINPDGRMHANSMQASRKVHRYAFHSLEFMDDDPGMNPVDLVEVTVSP